MSDARHTTLTRRGLLATAGVLAAGPLQAQGQSFPNRPLRLIVPFPPAGAADVMSRVVAEAARAAFDQNVVVENRSGGGGTIGTEAVMRSAPDGYTVLMANQSTHSINPEIRENPGLDPVTMVPIASVGNVAQVLYVRPSLAARSVPELIALAKANPGQLTYGTAGIGTGGHLAMMLLEAHAGIALNHIPFRGTAPSTAAVLAGQVDMMIDTMPTALPHIQNDAVRPLAVTTTTRHARLPQVPSLTEAGFNDYEAVLYYALFAPPDTPEAIAARLGEGFEATVALPAVANRLTEMGCDPLPVPRAALAAHVAADRARWRAVIRRAGIRIT
ncbi:Bug family tripartite tricarboxylate transporter substrate binding protein [Roseomonas sp. F4]